MNTLAGIASALKDRLKLAHLRQVAVADSSGITPKSLSRILTGRADFRVSTLLAVADRLGLEVVLVPKVIAGTIGLDDEEPVPSVVDMALQRQIQL